jgi:hypothetical protein
VLSVELDPLNSQSNMPLAGQQRHVGHEAQSLAASERTRSFFGRNTASNEDAPVENSEDDKGRPTRWSMGVLNDPKTHEVPGMSGNKWQSLKQLNTNSFRFRTLVNWRA